MLNLSVLYDNQFTDVELSAAVNICNMYVRR